MTSTPGNKHSTLSWPRTIEDLLLNSRPMSKDNVTLRLSIVKVIHSAFCNISHSQEYLLSSSKLLFNSLYQNHILLKAKKKGKKEDTLRSEKSPPPLEPPSEDNFANGFNALVKHNGSGRFDRPISSGGVALYICQKGEIEAKAQAIQHGTNKIADFWSC